MSAFWLYGFGLVPCFYDIVWQSDGLSVSPRVLDSVMKQTRHESYQSAPRPVFQLGSRMDVLHVPHGDGSHKP